METLLTFHTVWLIPAPAAVVPILPETRHPLLARDLPALALHLVLYPGRFMP